MSELGHPAMYSGRYLTPRIAWAAAMDAGNRSMRQAGRRVWNEADQQAAYQEFERLAREGGFWIDEGTNDPEALERYQTLKAIDRGLSLGGTKACYEERTG